jgi:hypothetical protein
MQTFSGLISKWRATFLKEDSGYYLLTSHREKIHVGWQGNLETPTSYRLENLYAKSLLLDERFYSCYCIITKSLMKKLLFLILIIPQFAYSQSVRLVQGSLQPLQDQTSIIVTFNYDDVRVGKYGELAEADYVQSRKKEYNDKQPGRGDKWERSWYDGRQTVLEPKFKLLLEKYGDIKATSDARYTLIFNTLRLDPGWNLGIPISVLSFVRDDAEIDGEIFIVETANPDNLIARIEITKARGHVGGTETDSNNILSESYARSGKEVGKMIAKTRK